MFDADPTERSPAKPRAQAGELRLTVLGGHHAGSTLALGAEGTVLIGSSEAADIILMDAGIAHEHLILTCGPEQIGLTAGDGGVAIGTGRDARKMSTGESTALTLPARFTLVGAGGWMIEIAVEAMEAAAPQAAARGRGSRGRKWAQLGLLSVASVFALLVLNGQSSFSVVPDSLALSLAGPQDAAREPSETSAEPAVEPRAEPPAPRAAVAQQALRSKLEAAELDMLTVVETDGMIGVSGVITPTEMQKWRPISRWYDGVHGTRVPISAEITVAEQPFKPPQKPTGIWLGEVPYIIDAKGVRRKIGETTSDGWEILFISAEELLLRRDDRQVAIAF